MVSKRLIPKDYIVRWFCEATTTVNLVVHPEERLEIAYYYNIN